MPIVTPVDMSPIIDIVLSGDPDRDPGLHVSSLIFAIMQSLQPDKYRASGQEDRDSSFASRMLLGLAWEIALEKALVNWHLSSGRCPESIVRPPALRVDGIWGSPDGYDLELDAILEYKVTWKAKPSEKKNTTIEDDKFLYYILQMQSYCHMAGTDKSRLIILFVNGDYMRGYSPELCGWDFTWTDEELRKNWEMILRWRDKLAERRA